MKKLYIPSLIINNGSPVFSLNNGGYELVFTGTGSSPLSWSDFTIDTVPYSSSVYTSLGFNSNNNGIGTAYYDFTNKTLKMSDGNSWLPNIADIGVNVGNTNSVAIDSAGKTDIAYSDNYNGKLLFFQEANGNFISTNQNYVNSPTSCDANKFNMVNIGAYTMSSLASNLLTDDTIDMGFPLNIGYISIDENDNNLPMFLFGVLNHGHAIRIDQNEGVNPTSFTLTLYNEDNSFLNSYQMVKDISFDLLALQNGIVSFNTDFMDTSDPLYSSLLHNFSFSISLNSINITNMVSGNIFYGSVVIGNGSYIGIPYGLSQTCPQGSTSTLAGYACDIQNLPMYNFFKYFFPNKIGQNFELLVAGMVGGVSYTTETVQNFFTNINVNTIINGFSFPEIPSPIDMVGGGTNHVFIDLHNIQYNGLVGNGIHQGALDFSTNVFAEAWLPDGNTVTCGGGTESVHIPIVPNVPNNLTQFTTSTYITSNMINMFAIDGTFVPYVGSDVICSPHIASWGTQFFGKLFALYPQRAGVPGSAGSSLEGLFYAPQFLTNELVNTSPFSTYLSSPTEINSMVLSTNGLDIYMREQ